MADYILLTDGACDFPEGKLEALGIRVLPMTITVDGGKPSLSTELSPETLYADLRQGKTYKTSAISIGEFSDVFEEIFAEGKDLIYIGFSSALSSTFHNATLAAAAAEEDHPGRHALLVDTKGASSGVAYLCVLAAQKKASGARVEETAAYLNELAPYLAHRFTVDDLFFLKKGGRISTATAVLGTVLQFKPMLHINEEGRLVAVGKVRGRKAAIAELCDRMEATLDRERTPFVMICHADCLSDAEALSQQVTERFGYEDVTICDIGATIGAHAGPGTLALFYVGTER